MAANQMKALSAFEKLPVDVQQRILNASAAVFAQEGYHHASIANICSQAHISNGALYKYFKNKEALFFAILDNSVSWVEDIYRKNLLGDAPLFDSIRALLNALAKYAHERCDYLRIYSDLGSSSMNRFAAKAAEKFKLATSYYTIRFIREAKARGELREDFDVRMMAYLIDNYITVFSYSMVSEYEKNRYASFFPGWDDASFEQEMIENIVSSIKRALSAPEITC